MDDNGKGAFMKNGRPEFLYCLFLVALLTPAGIKAQDFRRTYPLGTGGQLRVRNISGDVKISGYSGNSVEVTAYKVGRDRDKIQVEDKSYDNRLEFGVRYLENRNTNASVNFVIRVPQSVQYALEISSVSGNIQVAGVTSQTKLDSVSGDVTAQNITGVVSAHTVSGNLNVEIRRLRGSDDLKISSVSGNIQVKAPPDLNADVKMSSVSGSLKTDFPIQIHEQKYGPGQSAGGRLGAGLNNIRLSTVSGRISLHQRQR
jgi:DUF4097 and DUF4098 domain-containing protein YvlB